MSEVYDTGLWNNVLLAAKKEGMDLACGTYLMYSGPSYEPRQKSDSSIKSEQMP